jgi:hypothetical protein
LYVIGLKRISCRLLQQDVQRLSQVDKQDGQTEKFVELLRRYRLAFGFADAGGQQR